MTEILKKRLNCIYIVCKTFYLVFIHFNWKDIPTVFSPVVGLMCPHNKKKLIYAQPFDQKLGSWFIYFFYLHKTIRQIYMILFHLFFLLCTTIRPKIRVFIDIFLLFAHDTTIRQIYMIFFVSFIFSLCTTIRSKIWVLINLLLLFVHNHSTMFRLQYCHYTSSAIFIPLYFVHYIHIRAALIFLMLYPWLYEVSAGIRTPLGSPQEKEFTTENSILNSSSAHEAVTLILQT